MRDYNGKHTNEGTQFVKALHSTPKTKVGTIQRGYDLRSNKAKNEGQMSGKTVKTNKA